VLLLLLWGERDGAVPDERRVILPGIGHVPIEERPQASARVLRAFLGGEAGG